jgi:hypothetical protein
VEVRVKKTNIPKIRIPVVPIIIFIVSLAIIAGLVNLVKGMQLASQNHDEFRGNIENLYYYLKKEPDNFEMYAVLNKGDSVALSVWNNYLSTSDDTVKKYEKQLRDMTAGTLTREVKGIKTTVTFSASKYKEYALLQPLTKALELFKTIRLSNKDRIEKAKGFDEKKYQSSKKELIEMLKNFTEEAKKVNLDLR